MSTLSKRLRRLRNREERGAALLEFAIAVPIFIALLALVFDAGLGYSAARSSSSAARSAARVGALAGETRNADFLILDSLRAQYGDGSDVQWIVVYRSDPSNTTGAIPAGCDAASVAGLCNVYPGAILGTLNAGSFTTAADASGDPTCGSGSPDEAWCPLNRRANEGSFLGVSITSTSTATVGIGASEFDLEDRAVFAMYFPPEPAATE